MAPYRRRRKTEDVPERSRATETDVVSVRNGGHRSVRARRIALTLSVVGFGIYVLWPLLWQLGIGLPGNAEFYLHQNKYRNIISQVKAMPMAQVKAMPMAAETPTHLRIDDLAVDAEHDRAGIYTVTITTVDWDHAGMYGYTFSDRPLNAHPNPVYPSQPQVGSNANGMPFAQKSIWGQGGCWWSVYDNLL